MNHEQLNGTQTPLVWTGMKSLDQVMGPLTPSLTLVGARPGEGTSSLLREWAYRVANKSCVRRGVVVFSLEATREETVETLMFQIAGVDRVKLIDPTALTSEDRQSMTEAFAWVERRPWVWVVDRLGLEHGTPEEMEDIVRQIQSREAKTLAVEVAMVVVDGLQIDGRLGEPEATSVANRLHQVSQRLKVAVVAGAPLHSSEKDGRPSGGDAWGADAAHRVILIHNPRYLERRRHVHDGQTKYTETSEDVEIIIDKNRGGRTGIVPVKFHPWCTAFSDPADPQGPQ
jgi:replicative DNA helicase